MGRAVGRPTGCASGKFSTVLGLVGQGSWSCTNRSRRIDLTGFRFGVRLLHGFGETSEESFDAALDFSYDFRMGGRDVVTLFGIEL